MVSCRIQVEGRVQGVGFRYFVYKTAEKHGIKGFVKNLPDRTVYIEVTGDETNVAEFVSECKKGPGSALVTGFHLQEIRTKVYNDFRIER